MAVNEFDLIQTFFARQAVNRSDVIAGIGDDAALLKSPAGHQLVVTTDVLVSGIHFFPDVDPYALGHKALAVNLSDLASMGAEPAWFLLNLTLPEIDREWLSSFSRGLFQLAREHNVQLVGGDTSRGPLSIAIEAHGFVPEGRALRRSGAQVGDGVYVTGTLGDAALVLLHRLGRLRLSDAEFNTLVNRLDRPIPRVSMGLKLREIAHSAIDISDGLAADLGHILDMSKVGAEIRLDQIPLSPVVRSRLLEAGWDAILANGDDYELCFTLPEINRLLLEKLKPVCDVQQIGIIQNTPGLRILDSAGQPISLKEAGHVHFS